jgi:hypothetical protein
VTVQMLTSLTACRHPGRSILVARVAEEPRRSLAYRQAAFGELHATTRDGIAAQIHRLQGDSLKTRSCRRRDCVTSQAGVISDRSKRKDGRYDEPKHDNETEPEKENVHTHFLPVLCA